MEGIYISRFQKDCSTYIDGYQVSPTVNGEDISAIATGEAGPEQGEKYMNVFSNYSEDQNSLCLETNVYREYIINDDFEEIFHLRLTAKGQVKMELLAHQTLELSLKSLIQMMVLELLNMNG